MKKTKFLFLFAALAAFTFMSCNYTDFKRTKSGVLYKIIPGGNSKDSVARAGDVIKFNVISKLNDSVLFTSYGKMPEFSKVPEPGEVSYSPVEIFGMLKKGDSAVAVLVADSFLNKGHAQELPPQTKKGDRFTSIFKVLEVFRNDSLARADYNEEAQKDLPRRQKEMQDQQAKIQEQRKAQKAKEEEELIKSGEVDKELKEMKAYLAAKKINAVETGKGVFVAIKQQGDGPKVDSGKLVTVKYTGRKLDTDSIFQSNSYTFVVGIGQVIEGWDEGLMLFKKGGKGTIYIPGFLAYGKDVAPGSEFKPLEPLIFDVEITDVKDNTPEQATKQ